MIRDCTARARLPYGGLGSTVTLARDSEPGESAAWTYDAFGEVRSTSGTLSTDFLFTGEQRDSEGGLYYLRARYYDPSIGRFLTRDPFRGWVASPQSQNRYAYVMNNPANFADPTGLCVCVFGKCAPCPPPAECLLNLPSCTKRTAERATSAAGEVLRVARWEMGLALDALEYWRDVRYGPPPKEGGYMEKALEHAWGWLTSRSPRCYINTAMYAAYCGSPAAAAMASGVGAEYTVYTLGLDPRCTALLASVIASCSEQ